MSKMQQIAELLATHMLNQKARSVAMRTNEHGKEVEDGCIYFSPIITDEDGEIKQLCCGAAPLLDKSKFDAMDEYEFKCFNTELIDDLAYYNHELFKPDFQDLTKEELDLATSFQNIHDNTRDISLWLSEIRNLFYEKGLDYTFLKNWE